MIVDFEYDIQSYKAFGHKPEALFSHILYIQLNIIVSAVRLVSSARASVDAPMPIAAANANIALFILFASAYFYLLLAILYLAFT